VLHAFDTVRTYLEQYGLHPTAAFLLTRTLVVVGVLLLSVLANFIAKKYVLKLVHYFARKSRTRWDDIFVRERVFERVSHLAPALVLYICAALMFYTEPKLAQITERVAVAYMVVVGCLIADALLSSGLGIYEDYEIAKQRPIKAYLQVLKIFVYLVSAIFVLSVLIGESPWALLSGLGALTAVLMLVFKDSILGFVASIQLAANNMVRPGDWIEMPKYGADGDIIDVSLATVKVQNWDKTITTIPTYALLSDSFKNWRGMSESDGRRIKRALSIDMNTICFCDEDMLERFKGIDLLSDYITGKEKEIAAYNCEKEIDEREMVNGRRMTNIGVFRAYVVSYLRSHPQINKNMTFLVRHLQPTEQGLPIEIYVFSSDKVWAHYEGIQADIFDHILAVIPEFGLRVFQNPSGYDFRGIAA